MPTWAVEDRAPATELLLRLSHRSGDIAAHTQGTETRKITAQISSLFLPVLLPLLGLRHQQTNGKERTTIRIIRYHSEALTYVLSYFGVCTVAGKHRETRWLEADMRRLVRGYKGCPGRLGIPLIKLSNLNFFEPPLELFVHQCLYSRPLPIGHAKFPIYGIRFPNRIHRVSQLIMPERSSVPTKFHLAAL